MAYGLISGQSMVLPTLTNPAQPNQLLTGTQLINQDRELVVGTMPNRGTVNRTLTQQGQQYTIPQGYHSGSGKITANFSNLTAGNVRDGVNIGGVVGTYSGEIPLNLLGTARARGFTLVDSSGWNKNVINVQNFPSGTKIFKISSFTARATYYDNTYTVTTNEAMIGVTVMNGNGISTNGQMNFVLFDGYPFNNDYYITFQVQLVFNNNANEFLLNIVGYNSNYIPNVNYTFPNFTVYFYG